MPVKELRCPECGAEVEMGLPRGSTVKAITAVEKRDAESPARKSRELVCRNGHEFYVFFEF